MARDGDYVQAAEAQESLKEGKPLVSGFPTGEREVQDMMSKLEEDAVFGYVPSEKRSYLIRNLLPTFRINGERTITVGCDDYAGIGK